MIYIVRDFSKINLWGPCVFAAYGFKTAFARGNDNLWILRHAKKINFFFVKKICGPFGCVFRNVFLRAGSEDKNKTCKFYVFNEFFFFYFIN